MRTLKVSGDLHKTSYRLLVIIIILQFYSNILFSDTGYKDGADELIHYYQLSLKWQKIYVEKSFTCSLEMC